jgi:branched-chain amino acid transport system substrate-binding protein
MRFGLGRAVLAAALAVAIAPDAKAEGSFEVKLGVLTDMSSVYQDPTGPGSLLAVNMAVEDYAAANPKSALKVTVLSADHLNKADVGVNITRQWFERDGVDAVVDVPNSAVALAISELAKQFNKANLNASAGSARLTGDACSPNTVQWNFDNYALANVTGRAVVASGGDTWFFLTSDYAFGHDLEAQTMAVVKKQGGTVVGAVRHPLNSSDFSSFLLQAQSSGAR